MKSILSTNQKAKKRIVLGLIMLLAPVLFLAGYAYRPTEDRVVETTVYIPRGTGFLEAVDILDRAGMVKHKPCFILLAKLKRVADSLKAGEYDLSTALSPNEIINKLHKGEVKIRRITIPEDYTVKQIADRLVAEGLVTEVSFMSLATDPDFLASLGIDAPSTEGYLFPDTYKFNRGMVEQEVIRMMVSRFREKVTPEMIARAKQLGMTPTEFVTLASLIGKETGREEEKDRISAVFHNRLKRGMRLQSDPTAVYRLDAYRNSVTRKDLDNDTPYNTYKIKGLPPGPIANPGIDSLRAALNPASVKALYFVSKNDGTHIFSSNLAEHAQAVLKYQIKRKKE
jgi:UPF0755 protein